MEFKCDGFITNAYIPKKWLKINASAVYSNLEDCLSVK
jgi:hypothetical protein